MGVHKITHQISNDLGDADEADDGTSFSSTGLTLYLASHSSDASARNNVGLHFNQMAIPGGAKIQLAWVQLSAASLGTYTIRADIYCEDVDDATHFGTTADVTSRTTTTATADWDVSGSTPDGRFNTPDISACIQEVVDRGGWSSPNDIVVLLKGKSAGANQSISFYAHDDGSGDRAATLHVIYTEPGTDHAPRGFHLGQ